MGYICRIAVFSVAQSVSGQGSVRQSVASNFDWRLDWRTARTSADCRLLTWSFFFGGPPRFGLGLKCRLGLHRTRRWSVWRDGRSADPRGGNQSHRTTEKWQGCRRRWHPARNLEAWRRNTALQTPRTLRMLLGAEQRGKVYNSTLHSRQDPSKSSPQQTGTCCCWSPPSREPVRLQSQQGDYRHGLCT